MCNFHIYLELIRIFLSFYHDIYIHTFDLSIVICDIYLYILHLVLV